MGAKVTGRRGAVAVVDRAEVRGLVGGALLLLAANLVWVSELALLTSSGLHHWSSAIPLVLAPAALVYALVARLPRRWLFALSAGILFATHMPRVLETISRTPALDAPFTVWILYGSLVGQALFTAAACLAWLDASPADDAWAGVRLVPLIPMALAAQTVAFVLLVVTYLGVDLVPLAIIAVAAWFARQRALPFRGVMLAAAIVAAVGCAYEAVFLVGIVVPVPGLSQMMRPLVDWLMTSPIPRILWASTAVAQILFAVGVLGAATRSWLSARPAAPLPPLDPFPVD